MKFRISYTTPPGAILKRGFPYTRIVTASDWGDCVNITKGMIDDGYKITGIEVVPLHMEVTPWTA